MQEQMTKHDVQAKSHMDTALDTAIEVLKQPTIESVQPVGDLMTCFIWICSQDTNYWCSHVFVYPCTVCSFQTNISLNRVRNAMKRLAKYGYVERDSEGGYDEWNEHIFCCHGYAVTKKGRDTAIYRKFERQAIEEIERSLHDGD